MAGWEGVAVAAAVAVAVEPTGATPAGWVVPASSCDGDMQAYSASARNIAAVVKT